MHFLWNRVVPKLDFLLWFHRDVHVLLRPLADLRVWDAALRPVSLQWSSMLNCILLFVLILTRFLSSPHRVDVTEVQIAIIIMYLMSAFGGVSLWQITVTQRGMSRNTV